MIFELQSWSVYLGLAIAGTFTGIGVSIGSVIVKHFIEPKIEKIKKKIKRRKK